MVLVVSEYTAEALVIEFLVTNGLIILELGTEDSYGLRKTGNGRRRYRGECRAVVTGEVPALEVVR